MKLSNLILAISIITSAQAAEATKGEKYQLVAMKNDSVSGTVASYSHQESKANQDDAENDSYRRKIQMREFIREINPGR